MHDTNWWNFRGWPVTSSLVEDLTNLYIRHLLRCISLPPLYLQITRGSTAASRSTLAMPGKVNVSSAFRFCRLNVSHFWMLIFLFYRSYLIRVCKGFVDHSFYGVSYSWSLQELASSSVLHCPVKFLQWNLLFCFWFMDFTSTYMKGAFSSN